MRDFVHKVRIALKQVRETRYWLKLTVRAGLVNSPQAVGPLLDEADQLVAILTASANTARRRADHSAYPFPVRIPVLLVACCQFSGQHDRKNC
ncbi:MAG: four helix bundle protein [Polyangiaceae bacterium]|jgi:hypothetical protein|nr:four helix bundle protein [Polyangiaceae bacterium]